MSIQPCSFDKLICLLWGSLWTPVSKASVRNRTLRQNEAPDSTDIRNRTQLFRLSRNLLVREEKVFRSVRGGRGDPCKLNHYSKGSVFPKIAYSYSIRNITWRFNDLQDLLAKASPPRSDDYLAVIGRPVAEGQPRGSKERGRRQHWAQFLSPRTPWIQASRPAILRAHTGLKNRRTR